MTVIIVAPSIPDLPLVAEEAAALANALPDRQILTGEEATARGIINAIADIARGNGRVTGLWFASHGNEEGVMLTRGMLDAISLASLLSTAGASWLVLNTCGSRGLVNAIQLRAGVDVVATETDEIKDASAWEFGRLLAIQYARSGNLKQSVAQVAPGSDRHRYYEHNGRERMPEHVQTEKLSTDEKLNLLVGRIIGDKWRGVPGLVDTVGEIGASMAVLSSDMRDERKRREALAETVKHNQETTDSKFSTLTMWIWLMLAAVGLEGVVLIVMVMVLARPI
jgi:hypothetical protein